MNAYEQQEQVAREKPNIAVAIKVGFGMGLFLFIFTGGAPWIGAEPGYAAVGRSLPWNWVNVASVHFLLCITYMIVISMVIYSLPLLGSILISSGLGVALYAVNQIVFTGLGYSSEWGDAHAFTSHLAIGLFGGLLYKAMAVPRIA